MNGLSRIVSLKQNSLSAGHGFTLLEVVIALAIMAVVFSSLYGAYSSTLETTEQVENEREVEQAARLALAQMADDLKSVFYEQPEESEDEAETSPYRFVGAPADDLEDAVTVVEFSTTATLGFDVTFPNLQINRVSYVLIGQTENEGSRSLIRQESSFSGLGGQRKENTLELADGVEELTLSYVDEQGQEETEWDTDALQTKNRLPRLIKIELKISVGSPKRSRSFRVNVAPMAWRKESEG